MPAVVRVARLGWLALGLTVGWGLFVLAEAGAAPDTSPPRPSAEQLQGWIRQLGNDDFFVRERAQAELERLGIEAFDALTAAENDDDLEIALRVQHLLRIVRVQWRRPGDSPEVVKLLERYAAGNEVERVVVIDQLNDLPAGVELLCRLVRFEKSHVLARLAALALIERPLPAEGEGNAFWESIERGVEQSPRPAAVWLRAHAAAGRNAGGAIERWAEIVAAERLLLQQSPTQTRPEIVVRLLKHHVGQLSRANRASEGHPLMLAMLDLQSGDNDQLVDLLGWIVRQEAWPVIDEAAKRYQSRFEQEPLLLYTLADACRKQGNKDQAEATAAQALALNPESSVQHLIAGFKLQRQGWIPWSEGEYRLSIKLGTPIHPNTVRARLFLAEMLHDQGRDQDAGSVLEEGLKALETAANAGQAIDEAGDLQTFRARMHFFLSNAEGGRGNVAKQTEHLARAVAADPLDADVLIALHRLPERTEEQRKIIERQIAHAADVFRRQIQESPDDATPYNQFAWLVSNTTGDYREALRCSQRSLELKPNTAGYLDTLGRCYFAVGELDNAIRNQERAIELEPHSGLMRRQLEFFHAEAKRRAP